MKKRIVLTGGKFNRVHPGHTWLLKKAKKLGYLIIVLASDAHNKRPYARPEKERKTAIEKLKIADKVVVGSSKKFSYVIRKFHPNIIVLGYDQKMPDKETRQIAEKMKIKIVKFRKHGNYRTGKLIS